MPRLLSPLRSALALVSPVDCAGCGWPDVELCGACRAALLPSPSEAELPDRTPLVAGLVYAGVVRDVVLEFKQRGRLRLARPLGPSLAAALRPFEGGSLSTEKPIAVAVPSSRAGLRRRGYDPLDLLLRSVGVVPARPGLRILHATGAQKSRSRAERASSRVGTLRCSPGLAGSRVVLVDDVVTTGSTLLEAARAVRAAGAHVVGASCLAATPLATAKRP